MHEYKPSPVRGMGEGRVGATPVFTGTGVDREEKRRFTTETQRTRRRRANGWVPDSSDVTAALRAAIIT